MKSYDTLALLKFLVVEIDELEENDVSNANDQSSTEIDDATASPRKLENYDKPVSRPPTKLELIMCEKTSSSCYDVSWREDDNVLCSTRNDGIEVRKGTDLKLINRINITGGVYAAHTVGNQLITKVRNDNTYYSTYIGTESNPQRTLLHKYKSFCSYSQLSVSDSTIADIDRASKQLMIYTITGNHLYSIDISDMFDPYGVHILPDDDSILVSDCMREGEVRKYKLQAGKHHQPV